MGETKVPRNSLEPGETQGASCPKPDPLRILREEHALQNELCDLLEAIADGLPKRFDDALALVSVSLLESGLPSHMRLEEEALFPLLRRRVSGDHPLHMALVCLESEHDRDGAILVEIIDGLKTAIADGEVRNADMLGYMLRGFFESQRRHIAWEEAVLLPVAETVLTVDDLREMQDWVMRSGHPRCPQQSVIALRRARDGLSLCQTCGNTRTAADKLH